MYNRLSPTRYPIAFSGLLLLACSGRPASPAPAVSPADRIADRRPPAPAAAPTPPPAPTAMRQTKKPPVAVPPLPAAPPQAANPAAGLHDAWDQLLRRHVNATGKVDYKGFKADRAALGAYLETLAAHMPADTWSRAEQMAFWINAYNAFTVDLIATHYPVSSILNLDGGKTWDVRRILLGGKKYSLNQIENDILRPQFRDARIHFALNCAALSCPPLLNKAYTADNLDALLDERTRQFVNDPNFNTLAPEQARVSRIFEWYAVDFGDLKHFLNKYAAVKLGDDAAVRFLDYDWGLNGQD